MSWVATGVAVAGAATSMYENGRQRNLAQKREDKTRGANAQAIGASWARRDGKGEIPDIKWADIGKSDLGAGLQGGLQGYMVGSSMGGGAAKPSPSGGGTDASANALGGTDMSNQLGAQAKDFSSSMPAYANTPQAQPQTMSWNSMSPGGGMQGAPQMGSQYGPQDPYSMNKKQNLFGSK